MRLGMMQPYFFPYIGYFQGISICDKFLLYDMIRFRKRSWINKNRYRILTGVPAYFIAEVKRTSNMRIDRIQLADNDIWRRKMLNALFLNYKKHPFFKETYPVVEAIVKSEVTLLTELNLRSITGVCDHLGIATEISAASPRYEELERILLQDGFDAGMIPGGIRGSDVDTKTARIISVCRSEGADTYINPAGGSSLYSKEMFMLNGICLKYIQPGKIRYSQGPGDFIPDLSIIDVLMCIGKAGTARLLSECTLT